MNVENIILMRFDVFWKGDCNVVGLGWVIYGENGLIKFLVVEEYVFMFLMVESIVMWVVFVKCKEMGVYWIRCEVDFK